MKSFRILLEEARLHAPTIEASDALDKLIEKHCGGNTLSNGNTLTFGASSDEELPEVGSDDGEVESGGGGTGGKPKQPPRG